MRDTTVAPCRDLARAAEYAAMARDLATILRRKARSADRSRCSDCNRHPLAGELLHELENGRRVCQLCLPDVPEAKRVGATPRRVPVGERSLAVGSRAA